ncbi:hypothetical protein AALP_AAs39041U000200 [Arabis alpina]|uniref:non-specific serine/threonine protein kinase n=1 Tax=Arabis alpina TaxID=50452 RepID=A0A087G0E3_ARAAL|nr:hypothetical protein AALP_AAs39041U000200 [Arabis alpina]
MIMRRQSLKDGDVIFSQGKRDHPVNDTSGLIKFSSRGNLCVYGSVNGTEPIWSTDVVDTISEPALVAKLTDLGNLVLLNPITGKSFWESFNHPTDTFLPFMKLGFTRKDGLDRFLTSRKSPDDPGSGNNTYRIERRGSPQLILYKGLSPWWRTGSWTGQSAYHESEDGEKGCLTWHGDMLDTRTYLSSGQDFYLRVDKAELARWKGSGSSRKMRLVLILISMIAVVMLLMISLFCFIWKRRQSNRHRKPSSTFAPSSFDLEDSFILEDLEDKSRNRELPLFELSTIAAATNNFCFQNKLGAGGFGPVYKGVLQNGMEIAVKRLSTNSGQGMEEFKNEVKLISKLQHRNLVRILGCCVEFEEKMLIYEYLPNKSLDYFIFNEERRAELDWPKRMGIIRGIARGILYLHQDSRLRIIHRDLKASNVLLDNEMIPKIADFGLARIFGGNQIEGSTNRVVGTYGYMSPEYAMDGQFSIKSDVYSFGILILEIITGNKNSTTFEDSSNLVGHIWDMWNKGEAIEIIDKLMDQETYDESEVMKCIHIGLLCVQENALDRPDMSDVVFMLGHNAIDLPSPKHPAFTVGRKRSVRNGGSSGNLPSGETGSSFNDITLTNVEGR